MSGRANPLSTENINFIYSEIVKNQIGKGENVVLNKREEILILAIHTIFVALGFNIKLEGEEKDNNKYNLKHGWNDNEPYEFKYSHSQSQLNFLVKSIIVSNRIIVHGTTIETNETFTLELISDEYIPDQVSFPLEESEKLSTLFCNQNKYKILIQQVKEKLIQKLIPGLQKEGYQENSTSTSNITNSNPTSILSSTPIYEDNPLHEPPHVNPFAYGDRDLNPLGGGGGGFVPGLPRFGGGGSAIDPFGMMGGDNEGGMILGPNHPIFSPNNPHAPRHPGTLPPGSVPSGARFDPISPFGNRVDPRSSRDPRQPFSGEPDNDELPPPGFNNNMFM